MEKQRLLQTLEELRLEVAQTESVDSETLSLLEKAMQDLQRELDKRVAKQSAGMEPAYSGLKDLLQIVMGPVVALVGSATGFYFGTERASVSNTTQGTAGASGTSTTK